MSRASYLSIHLARFEALRSAPTIEVRDRPGVLFCRVATDTRAAGTEPASQQGFVFVVLGLHGDAASAHRLLDDGRELAPWLAEAREVWAAVLEPTRHKGACNYLDSASPGLVFERSASQPADAPFVALTTVGWNLAGLDMTRVQSFGAGLTGVRIAMTAVPGMHSQQTFFFPGAIALDAFSITFWRDDASVRAFAYAPGVHRHYMDRHNAEGLADRTSFTRLHVVRREGTWYGADPLAFT